MHGRRLQTDSVPQRDSRTDYPNMQWHGPTSSLHLSTMDFNLPSRILLSVRSAAMASRNTSPRLVSFRPNSRELASMLGEAWIRPVVASISPADAVFETHLAMSVSKSVTATESAYVQIRPFAPRSTVSMIVVSSLCFRTSAVCSCSKAVSCQ